MPPLRTGLSGAASPFRSAGPPSILPKVLYVDLNSYGFIAVIEKGIRSNSYFDKRFFQQP